MTRHFACLFMALALPLGFATLLMAHVTLSLDDVIISFFKTGPTFEVLPLRIYSMVRLGLKPEVNALCALMIALDQLIGDIIK